MGWLKELMDNAPSPIRGYGQLARTALAQPEWPKDSQPKARSLSALFSKLDRGIELDWLSDRPSVQLALSQSLGCTVQVLRSQVEAQTPKDESQTRQIRFDDLPFARPFELLSEALPPGIPNELTMPSSWQQCWWVAAAGAGRTLVGQWLAARGRAQFILARTWEEAIPRILGSLPVYVELERGPGPSPLEPLPTSAPLCIAAPFDPPEGEEYVWTKIPTVRWPDHLPALLDWVEARLPEDGSFSAPAALKWLEPQVLAGVLPTFGAIVGAAGMLDAVGLQRLGRRSLEHLVAEQVSQRLKDASAAGSAEAQWLQDHGFDLVVRLAQQVLTHTEEPWAQARDEDEWIRLIPEEYRQSIDAQWVTWSLARAGGQTTVREIEQALREVPPGAYRVVKGLTEARLLRTQRPGKGLVLSPHVLRHVAVTVAERLLVTEGSPFDWGEALLRPHAEQTLIQRLSTLMNAGDLRPVDNLLDLEVQSQPSLAVAIEASFVCAGRSLLCGQELPEETVTQLWDEQLALLLPIPGRTAEPRLLGAPDELGKEPLLRLSAWHLSALALSEKLPASQGVSHATLRPWQQPDLSPETEAVLDSIQKLLVCPQVRGEPWVAAAYALIYRLHAAVKAHRVHPLAVPSLVARGVIRGKLNFEAMGQFGLFPSELDALEEAGQQLELPWPRLVRGLWHLWAADNCPAAASLLLRPDATHSERLWAHLPISLFAKAWKCWEPRVHPWPYTSFDLSQWQAFAQHWSLLNPQTDSPSGWVLAFAKMDSNCIVELALRTEHKQLKGPQWLLQLAWARSPIWALNQLETSPSAQGGVQLEHLLQAAPPELTSDAVAYLRRGLSGRDTGSKANYIALLWLRSRIALRVQGWREAHSLLLEVQQRVARSNLARGSAPPSHV